MLNNLNIQESLLKQRHQELIDEAVQYRLALLSSNRKVLLHERLAVWLGDRMMLSGYRLKSQFGNVTSSLHIVCDEQGEVTLSI